MCICSERITRQFSADKLVEFGVLNITTGRNSLQSTNTKRYLDRLHLVETVDYGIRPQLGPNSRGVQACFCYKTSK
jgi:hypothetical protein